MDSEAKIISFFQNQFPDVYSAMPRLVHEYLNHPIGHLSTVKSAPWHYKDECLLIGDAAHGIVPFFGQGMNSAFEDCRVLDNLLEQYQDNWSEAIPAFYKERKKNTDAVAEMSMDNYHEIQVNITDESFHLRKKIERELMRKYPERYITKHILVMFTNMPYAKAQAYGKIQDELLADICNGIQSMEEVDWQLVDKKIEAYEKALQTLE